MAITNPTSLVNVEDLAHFKGKLDPILETKADKSDTYTKQEVDDMALASMFRLYVDPADMPLKGRNPSDGTFEVVDGHLVMHQAT